MQNYTGYGWEGNEYNRDLGITDISKIVKQRLKNEYPDCKFSVTVEKYSMGQSMTVALMEAPFEVYTGCGQIILNEFVSYPDTGYHQLNQFQFKNPYSDLGRFTPNGWNNGVILTPHGWDCLRKATLVSQGFNYDDSDSMIDYFSTNFHLHLEIGKWNKPFRKV